MLRFETTVSSPVIIDSVELLRFGETYLVRSRSTEGAVGIAATTKRIQYLRPLLSERIAPFFVGRDARELESLIEGVYLYRSNYKLVGLPFWSCVAWVELSLIDLLGQLSGQSAGALLGGAAPRQVPVYLSFLSRKLAPAAVVELVGSRLAETGARAVKVKIGGRMSRNVDVSPGRTEQVVSLLRRELGDGIRIYADANGTYTADRAIEVGRMLEANGVGFIEEPCPFEHYEATRQVARALTLPVAGGEQDSSRYRWEEILRDRVVDLPQPDLVYNGGYLRTLWVAARAAAAGLHVSLHNPHRGPAAAYMLHLATALPSPAADHEWNAAHENEAWYEPQLRVRGGSVEVPTGPGLGLRIDPGALRRAELVKRVRRFTRTVHSLFRGRAGL